ncbi:IS200/IS605 family transposase [Flavivirga aquimarina]|uniref:IS200/IS605 family transposase n=1 Tax=Flavivirga aquimarina TaxID=2027862 RepID=A0ABT8W9N2_9FLAO|nr:IS200/IS605 family transposase [Flavivirga aquimarina]MDO5969788.1 IS200/IS605 family transposase [Flavivirga aquimarina]
MGEHIFKRHNKTLLLYHLVFPLKYRQLVITEEIGESLKRICLDISERYEVHFIEIGHEPDHVHFLVQSVPGYSVSKMINMLKSITAKELYKRFPEIKAKLWGGKFWTSGFYANTVGQYANEEVIRAYVKGQGKEKEYKKLHTNQLTLF